MIDLVTKNFDWMTVNILLAVIPLVLGWTLYSTKTRSMKILFFFAWLIFMPNTIYLFTDILHLIKDINHVDLFGGIILTLQYVFLFTAGFLTYILSLYPIEKMLGKNKKKNSAVVIIGINFLIGVGIVLGRVYRLNSWDIVVEIEKVIFSTIHFLSSPEMISLALLFGLFANFLYFSFKKQTVKYILKKNLTK